MVDTVCATCAFWHRGGPGLATAERAAAPLENVGACELYAPTIVQTTWFAVSMFPETHASRTCGDWQPEFDPEDGAREPIETNVVPLTRVA